MKIWVMIFLSILFFQPANASKPLVSVEWLKQQLNTENLVIIDLRNKIDKGGIKKFREGHIPGSLHSDYLKDGWRVSKNGIPGILPTQLSFKKLVESLGISNSSHVVLVPAGVSSTDFGSSARAYWQFKVFGHDKVSILDGGYAAWINAYADMIETGNGRAATLGQFSIKYRPQLYVSTEEVAKVSRTGNTILLDARNEAQWEGKAKHPAAKAPGRIPRSSWLWQGKAYNNYENRLKSQTELDNIFDSYKKTPVISYSNTGHWAATNWFVLSEILGNKDVRLYDGSMTEWTAEKKLPLVTKQTKLDDIKDWFKKKLTNS